MVSSLTLPVRRRNQSELRRQLSKLCENEAPKMQMPRWNATISCTDTENCSYYTFLYTAVTKAVIYGGNNIYKYLVRSQSVLTTNSTGRV